MLQFAAPSGSLRQAPQKQFVAPVRDCHKQPRERRPVNADQRRVRHRFAPAFGPTFKVVELHLVLHAATGPGARTHQRLEVANAEHLAAPPGGADAGSPPFQPLAATTSSRRSCMGTTIKVRLECFYGVTAMGKNNGATPSTFIGSRQLECHSLALCKGLVRKCEAIKQGRWLTQPDEPV